MPTFSVLALDDWRALEKYVSSPSPGLLAIDSHSLTISDVVAVARHGAAVRLSQESIDAIASSSDIISQKLADGAIIYGVNTGYGGSADTRTNEVVHLQQSLFSHLMYGITAGITAASTDGITIKPLPLDDPTAATCLPESWARASMLVRLNSLAGGASGVRVCIAESLVELINNDIVPRIPLRGSISASGDLSPLSYVGALMQGKPSMAAFTGTRQAGARKVVAADVALAEAGVRPVEIEAKEGLAIVNGTAVSVSVAALAIHESMNLAALSQVLTAMSVEALLGTDESFDPFIAKLRPHPGQVDSAENIRAFLAGSKLVTRSDEDRLAVGELRQDRYSIRTASQWIGPVLEDFMLAREQITTELNSVTDNPLLEASSGKVFHGGNFQAKSVTSAVEKLRQGLQSLGRMLFSQGTELMNPATNRGLPPNLVFDEPSTSYMFQGVDIMMAALTSELGFLANPVGSHVQTAEKGNQAINSLALISGRYTLEAVDVLTQLAAAHLAALCQALDLRAMNRQFQDTLFPEFEKLIHRTLPAQDSETLFLFQIFLRSCDRHTALDSSDRFATVAQDLQPHLLRLDLDVPSIRCFTSELQERAAEAYRASRASYLASETGATPYLGEASKRMYTFLRKGLGVPVLTEARISGMMKAEEGAKFGVSVGSYQTIIYEAIRTGRLYEVVMECFSLNTE